MSKHVFTREERSRGGKNQPKEAKQEAGRRGFLTTINRHPWMWPHLRYARGMSHYKAGGFEPRREIDG